MEWLSDGCTFISLGIMFQIVGELNFRTGFSVGDTFVLLFSHRLVHLLCKYHNFHSNCARYCNATENSGQNPICILWFHLRKCWRQTENVDFRWEILSNERNFLTKSNAQWTTQNSTTNYHSFFSLIFSHKSSFSIDYGRNFAAIFRQAIEHIWTRTKNNSSR